MPSGQNLKRKPNLSFGGITTLRNTKVEDHAKTSDRSVRGFRLGENGLPNEKIVSRWRLKLSNPETFERTYEQALARYIKILELDPSVHVTQNTGENEWYTPGDIIEAARAVLGGIDLDPASTAAANEIVQAATFFSAMDDGLKQYWHGHVWMNPPYAQPLIEHFAKKLAASIQAHEVSAAIALVNNATETEWFQTMGTVTDAVCFPSGRIRFWNPAKETAMPLQGQALLYMGPQIDHFCERFASFGIVLVKFER
jgi:phage N-6-adenine-methyltransferase